LTGTFVAGCLELESGETTGTSSTTGGSPTGSTARTTTSDPTTAPATEPPTTTREPETPEPTVSYPLGISDDEVSGALADTHHRAALDTSFTLSYDVESFDNRDQRTYRADPAAGMYEVQHRDDVARRHTFQREGRIYCRVSEDDRDDPAFFVSSLVEKQRAITRKEAFKSLLQGAAFSPTATYPEQTPKTIDIAAAEIADAIPLETAFNLNDANSLTGEGVVRESGLIDSLTVGFEGVRDGSRGQVSVVTSTTDVGETTVEEPDWIERARELAPAFDLGAADDYLELTNNGDGPLPARGYHSVATAGGEGAYGNNADPVPVGATLYLALPTSGTELLAAVGEPPEGDRASLSSEVSVRTRYRGVGAFEGSASP